MRSDEMKKGVMRSPHRCLMKSIGFTDRQLSRPIIGVVNSANEIIPGHIHLDAITRAVKDGILMAGGTPMEFRTIGICDGISMGHVGMKYSLVSREIIADSVEAVAMAHPFDGLVLVVNCDKIVPGMLMALLRLNVPGLLVSGGPMMAGRLPSGETVDLISVFEGIGRLSSGKISEQDLKDLEDSGCPGAGSCSGMFTANSMNCLTEALGMGLPGNGTIPAVAARRMRLAKEAGIRSVELVNAAVRPRDIVTMEAVRNAIAVDVAIGASTNTVLHLPAIAHEAGLTLDLDLFDSISRRTPNICRLSPASGVHLEDLDSAGGIPAVMKELLEAKLLEGDCPTVSGHTVAEIAGKACIRSRDVIRPLKDPHSAQGGLAILRGNLAPDGAVVKQSGVSARMLKFSGPARVFDSEEETLDAVMKDRIRKGDVVVIRYEGPRGGPGMREMLAVTSAIVGKGLKEDVYLLTDGRFSGGSWGACVGHVSPEAAEGGAIGLVRDGERIEIDIPARRLSVDLADDVLKERRAAFRPRRRELSGVLARYARQVRSAGTGAILEDGNDAA